MKKHWSIPGLEVKAGQVWRDHWPASLSDAPKEKQRYFVIDEIKTEYDARRKRDCLVAHGTILRVRRQGIRRTKFPVRLLVDSLLSSRREYELVPAPQDPPELRRGCHEAGWLDDTRELLQLLNKRWPPPSGCRHALFLDDEGRTLCAHVHINGRLEVFSLPLMLDFSPTPTQVIENVERLARRRVCVDCGGKADENIGMCWNCWRAACEAGVECISCECTLSRTEAERGEKCRLCEEDHLFDSDEGEVDLTEALRQLEELKALEPNWDGEGAVPPKDSAIERAKKVLDWVHDNDLVVTTVDADVRGGVGIHLGDPERHAWIACMNNGAVALVLSSQGETHHAPWNASARSRAIRFLQGGPST